MSPLRRGRLLGGALLVLLTGLAAVPYVPGRDLGRFVWFDACQRLAPRVRISGPVVIIAVDSRVWPYGQWPWPRTSGSPDRSGRHWPSAAIGIDIVMPEADRLTAAPAGLIPTIGGELAIRLAELPSNDAVLAQALRDRPMVLSVAGRGRHRQAAARTPPRGIPARGRRRSGAVSPTLRGHAHAGRDRPG
jgi:CHASE2 domain-containing sensor protein